jgi:hypothetical protein
MKLLISSKRTHSKNVLKHLIEHNNFFVEKEKERQDRLMSLDGSGTKPGVGALGIQRNKSERERKIGHRRVGVGGEITYKKVKFCPHSVGSVFKTI